ncbi:MAG: hypothetical protein JWP12_1250 [Bacteroidetes bacterium]|nr:hypothetical protein [Bacteroidota bacterium]
MIRLITFSFLIAAAVCMYSSCKNTSSGNAFTACDTAHFKQKENLSAHYHFCYPKEWKGLPPNKFFDEFLGESFADSATQYKKIFSIRLESTTNGRSALGDFKGYIDSSRKMINLYVPNVRVRTDKDTTWNDLKAHVFEFTGTISDRPLWTSQLIIDGASLNYFYVLNFQQRLDDPQGSDYDLKRRNDIFNSFVLKN